LKTIIIPIKRRRLIIFPTPKYLRTRKVAAPVAIIRPLLVFNKSVEKVKRLAKKKRIINKGSAPKEKGSIKRISKTNPAQRRIITNSVGRKFFLLFIISFLFLLPTAISF
jgi:hypothetical protein